MMHAVKRAVGFVFLGVWMAADGVEAVVPATLFSDHAVLQADKLIPVWGMAAPGEKVTVKLGKTQASAIADQKGKWLVELPAREASSLSLDLVIKGRDIVTYHDIRLGDVWLISGQSNMAWKLSQDQDYILERPSQELPLIRQYYTERTVATTPAATVRGSWSVANGNTAGNFSAVAWYFALAVHRSTGRPIGLLNTSWGNTPIEAWLPSGISGPVSTLVPTEKYQEPAVLYNGMVLPLTPCALRGILWYQGESNIGHAAEYRQLFPALINKWREIFQQPALPFLWVQLPAYGAGNSGGTDWAAVREAQEATLDLPFTGQAVALDQGTAQEIHPRHKREVGLRLARLALHRVYQIEIADTGPRFARAAVEGSSMRITFQSTPLALRTLSRPGMPGFELAGADRVFYPAEARIEKGQIVVISDAVSAPVAVRYAWRNAPESTLYNEDGLPASPFRSDNW